MMDVANMSNQIERMSLNKLPIEAHKDVSSVRH
jgi:hypothetical protein